jgi:hypothetical protein
VTAPRGDEELCYVEGQSHILVKRKSDVQGNVYGVLNEWAAQVPSVIALKEWERGLHAAVNSMFVDFHNRSPLWPMMFWQAAEADRISPSSELTRLITRLVVSRIKPMSIDLAPYGDRVRELELNDSDAYYTSLIKVLEGERIVADACLDATDIAPGDFFEITEPNGERRFQLNIRSECDCARGNPDLYLLKGKVVSDVGARINPDVGNIDAQEKHNEAIVVLMFEGLSISFKFRDLKIQKWNTLRAMRKGRLLSPFLARVIQRYGAYSARAGLPRLPPTLVAHLQAQAALVTADAATPAVAR